MPSNAPAKSRCPKKSAWMSRKCLAVPGIGSSGVSSSSDISLGLLNLAVVHPCLAKEWDTEKNGDIRPEDVRPKSNRKYWWKCSKGHEWQAVVTSRAAGCGCPYCYGRYATKSNNLASKYPRLLAEWDREKNEGLDPSGVTPYSGKKVWWRCEKGHSWQATVANRAGNSSGCPTCARNANRKYSMEDFQALAKKRGGVCLSRKYTSCRRKLKFCCKEGHIWEARADGVLYADKWCPVCAGSRQYKLPLMADRIGVTPKNWPS